MTAAPARAPAAVDALLPRLQRTADRRAADARERRLRRRGPAGPVTTVDGRPVIDFCSNDYLGFAGDPLLAEALARAAARLGSGAGASALVCGYTDLHAELEAALAALTGRSAAIVLPSGYHANLAVFGALARRGDRCLADRLCHASLIDGMLLARARLARYPHLDMQALAAALAAPATGLSFVVSDAVFSMDGDLAPLADIVALCTRHGAVPVIDDAHGIGVRGEDGAGSTAVPGLDEAALPVLVGTLGKAFGAAGAFVAGPAAVVEALRQQARTYAYTTALPPPVAAAALAAVRHPGAAARRARLQSAIDRFRTRALAAGIPLLPSTTPIQPVPIGDSAAALATSERLLACGFHCAAIRPPTVPRGTARLRVTLSAAHADHDIDALVAALARCL